MASPAFLPADFPNQTELMALPEGKLLEWIDTAFLRATPFAFREYDFSEIVRLASRLLDVDPNGIFCLGSGAIGLSLNPSKVKDDGSLKSFDDQSDLDLAVISSYHFDIAWRDLRRASQPTLNTLDPAYRELLKWQKKRLFDGAIIADKVLPLLSFSDEWTRGIGQLAEMIAVTLDRNIDVHVWIYRDYWGVRNYVSEGVAACRRKLI